MSSVGSSSAALTRSRAAASPSRTSQRRGHVHSTETFASSSSTSSSYRRPLESGSSTALSQTRKGKRKAVYFDVVVELSGSGQFEGAAIDYVSQLGTELPCAPLEQGTNDKAVVWNPVAPEKVDHRRVTGALRELWTTEESYSRKIFNFQKHFAAKLRQYATNPATMIISGIQAQGLFINLEELVQVSLAFEADLKDLVAELDAAGPDAMPAQFGDMILHHVRQMYPFKKWLASYDFARMLYDSLTTGKSKNVQFVKFVERMQISFRESAQTTAGFSELLAEPFQRIARYSMMIDPIIRHLPENSEDVEPLQAASRLLSEICSMQVDVSTKNAAVWWSLNEHIEGIPANYIKEGRQFIDAIDVDEHVQEVEPYALRCSLLLFEDAILVVKRTSSEGVRQICQLDSIDTLVRSWKVSQLATASNVLGTPRKKNKSMSFKGLAMLATVSLVDFDGLTFGLELPEGLIGSSDKWTGRTQRYYQVNFPEDPTVANSAKDRFMERLFDTKARQRDPLDNDTAVGRKSVIILGARGEQVLAYWSMKDRRSWEALAPAQKAPFALQIDTARPSSRAADLLLGEGKNGPVAVIRADLQNASSCLFSSKSNDGTPDMPCQRLLIDRLAEFAIQIAVDTKLSSFAPPSQVARARSNSRSRPRSAIFSAALEKFTGGSSSNLRRGESNGSKASHLNSPGSAPSTPTGGHSRSSPVSPSWSRSPRSLHPSPVQQPPALGANGNKHESPVWFNKTHSRSSSAVNAVQSQRTDDEDEAVEVLASERLPKPAPSLSRSTYTRPSRRRSSSLPAPSGRLAKTDSQVELAPIEPLFSSSSSRISGMSQSVYSQEGTTLSRGPSRRRLLGPRAPSAQGDTPTNGYAPARSTGSASSTGRTSPFQFEDSVEDVIVFGGDEGNMPGEEMALDSPAAQSDAHFDDIIETMMAETESLLDEAIEVDEQPAPSLPDKPLELSASATKRPLAEPSPRASPAKRQSGVYVAPLRRDYGERDQPSSVVSGTRGPQRRTPSGPVDVVRSALRNVSNSSTIRESGTAKGFASPVHRDDLFDTSTSSHPASALDRLKAYVDDLSEAIISTAEEKENDRVDQSPARLSRSPVRTDLSALGSAAALSSTSASAKRRNTIVSPGRGGSTMPEIDTAQLVRWLGTLRAMLDRINEPVASIAGGHAVHAANAELKAQVERLSAQIVQLRDEIDALNGHKLEVESMIETKEQELKSARETIASLRKSNDELQSAKTSATASIELQAQVRTLRQRIVEMEQEAAVRTDELTHAQEDYVATQERVSELEKAASSHVEEVTLAHDTITNLRKAHDNLRNMLISTNEAYLADTEQLFEELRTTDLSDGSQALLKQLQSAVVAERRARVAVSEAEREFQLERSDLESAIERKDQRIRQLEALLMR